MERGSVRVASIESEMRQSYLDYAMSVIVSRALPDARDGFKPVHRRVLYAMHQMGMRSTSRYRKSAGIVGEVIKNWHPHSDTAAYDTLVRMAQDFSLRYPLVDGQGNFGSVDGDKAAAMRYTEARMAAIADELLADIDKETVDEYPNYDASMMQPTVLPARLPNLLVNGSSGIAVGMATNIPPHNLNEVCDGIMLLLDDPETTVEQLMEVIPGPDFPTGGTIVGREGIQAAYATGRGRVLLRAKAFIEEQERNNRWQIVVTELPYQVNKAVLLERIAEMVREGRLDGISNLRDESDRNGMRIVIELKRDAQARVVLKNLYKHSQLQTTFGINMLALVERGTQPRVLTLKRALTEYIDHRQEVITRRTEYDLERARRRAHILEGLKIALDNIDEVIQTIRASNTTEIARTNLMQRFELTEIQANAILDMRLARLAALERQKIEDELNEVMRTIAYLESLLADPLLIRGLIREDVINLKEKYGDARRTTFMEGTGNMTDEDLIPEVDVLVTVTTKGYVKRLPQDTYRTQRRGGRGVTGVTMREEDVPLHMIAANTHDYLLVFTNRGRVYQIKVHELPDASRTAKGIPIVNVISMQPDETVTTLLKVRDYSAASYLFFTTRLGRVKRVALDQFRTVRSNGIIAMGLDDNDELAWVRMTSGSDNVVLVSTHGLAIRFDENDVRPMGRPAAGVIGMRLDATDRIIAFEVIEPDHELLVVAKRGLGKRTSLDHYRSQGRGGKGIKTMNLSPKTGNIVAAAMVSSEDSVVLMNNRGITIKIPASEIRQTGRAAQGVMLMRLGEGEEVVSMTVIEPTDPVSNAQFQDLDMSSLPDGGGR